MSAQALPVGQGHGRAAVARSGSVDLRGFALTAAAVRDFGPKRCCCLVVTQLLKVFGEVTGQAGTYLPSQSHAAAAAAARHIATTTASSVVAIHMPDRHRWSASG